MTILRRLLRAYSFLFETLLCGMGLLLGLFALANGGVSVNVGWLPWSGPHQMTWVLAISLFGFVSIGLALFGILRGLFLIFSLAVLYILLRGLFLNTSYTFALRADIHNALLLLVGSFLAVVGAIPIRRSSHI